MKKKIISIFTVLTIVISTLSFNVFAQNDEYSLIFDNDGSKLECVSIYMGDDIHNKVDSITDGTFNGNKVKYYSDKDGNEVFRINGGVSENAIDNNTKTYAGSACAPNAQLQNPYLEVDLGKAAIIKNVTLMLANVNDDASAEFNITVSLDGENWTVLAQETKEHKPQSADENICEIVERESGSLYRDLTLKTYDAFRYIRLVRPTVLTGRGYAIPWITEINASGYYVDVTNPKNGDTNVSNVGDNKTENITIQFCNEMNVDTLNPDNIYIVDENDNRVEYTDYLSSEQEYVIPLENLNSYGKYTVFVSESVQRIDGTNIEGYSFSFETGLITKGKKPISEIISSTYPQNNETDVSNTDKGNIEIHFAAEIADINKNNVKIKDSTGNYVDYSNEEFNGNVYTIPLSNLNSNETYTVSVSNINTTDGYESDGEYIFEFTTGIIGGNIDLNEVYSNVEFGNIDSVSNIDDMPFIEVVFKKDIIAESLKEAVVIQDNGGNAIVCNNCNYKNQKYYFDKSVLTSDTDYKLVIYSDKLKVKNRSVVGNNIEIPFKTSKIIAIAGVDGKYITDVAKRKAVSSSQGVDANVIVDGSVVNNLQIKSNKLIIDLNGYYNVVAVMHTPTSAYDYSNNQNAWHTNKIRFWLGNDYDMGFSTYKNVGITQSSPYSQILSVTPGYSRYIGIDNPGYAAVLGEISVYALIDVTYENLTYTLTGTTLNVMGSAKNYSGNAPDAYMVFACYDKDDNLDKIYLKKVDVSNYGNNTFDSSVTLESTVSAVKVFITTNINEFDIQTDVININV